MRAPSAARRGFTLLEIVVVVLLIGVVLAVGVPALRPPSRPAGGDAARQLARIADLARRASAARGAAVTVTLELASGAWSITAAADTVRQGRLALPSGVRLEGGRDGWATFVHHPLGQVRADPLSVRAGGVQHDLVVSPWSAAVVARPR